MYPQRALFGVSSFGSVFVPAKSRLGSCLGFIFKFWIRTVLSFSLSLSLSLSLLVHTLFPATPPFCSIVGGSYIHVVSRGMPKFGERRCSFLACLLPRSIHKNRCGGGLFAGFFHTINRFLSFRDARDPRGFHRLLTHGQSHLWGNETDGWMARPGRTNRGQRK